MPSTRKSLLAKLKKSCPGGAVGLLEMRNEQRLKIIEIAEICGVTRHTVSDWLKVLGVARERHTTDQPTEKQLELIRSLRDQGKTILAIMGHPDIRRCHATTKRWMELANRPIGRQGSAILRPIKEKSELLSRIIELHKDGYSCEAISRMLGEKRLRTASTVRRWLNAAGVDTSLRTTPTERQQRLIVQLHAEGRSYLELMAALGCTSANLANWLREFDLPLPTITRTPRQRKTREPETSRLPELIANPEPKVRVKVSKPPEPIAKLPPGHRSIAQRLREATTVTSGDYQGYRLITLESVPPERRMNLEDILSLEIPPDYQRSEKPC
jgi:transposase